MDNSMFAKAAGNQENSSYFVPYIYSTRVQIKNAGFIQ